MNTATSEMLIESTVKPICRAPTRRRRQRSQAAFHVADDVLDYITIASSTTKPTEIVSAISEKLSIV